MKRTLLRTLGWIWRGYFAVHTWVATKEEGADHYKVHEVTGWRQYVVNSRPDDPDRHWYGAKPELYADIRGEDAAAMIPDIYKAVESYPYLTGYQLSLGGYVGVLGAGLAQSQPDGRACAVN
ncbi:DUF3750 domain-containing protein [Marinobacter sp. P4B1]|uniref:DUF3750 domain-containing protein n=1 Tax=Marinobacter sp. P4B1 TaxID=1119533 RepID=UPI00072A21AA|nr:DUF3750 domain-containing protein [Marinobacter sp. P4B1]KRW82120.1 hypothetical protein AQ621_13600 [Marinobacter sp. P4B1]